MEDSQTWSHVHRIYFQQILQQQVCFFYSSIFLNDFVSGVDAMLSNNADHCQSRPDPPGYFI